MRVLVLGGYGLIGGEIMRVLDAAGHDLIGLGRNAALGRRLYPRATWIGADLSRLTAPERWTEPLKGVDAVVNAAGVLQAGPRDNLVAVQEEAIKACIAASERCGVRAFVQISAVGAKKNASTLFLRTKAEADAALQASALDWTILKPGLVISRNAYGGTALIRMLAAFPFVTPLVLSDAPVQTVAAEDVARAVVMTLEGRALARAVYDLVEDEPHSLAGIVARFRSWLGFGRALATIRLPDFIGAGAARCADIAGLLGWRSPLRTTALKVLKEGVTGDPAEWKKATGSSLKSLDQTLADIPPTAQERVYARAQLVLPLALVTLAAFWIASGVIGAVRHESAAAHLTGAADAKIADLLVFGGAALDMAIGAGLLVRPIARPCAVLSILVAFAYLIAGSIIAPGLWLDPLGVYVKVVPAIFLAAAVALLLEER
jgi:uncharacterized protein YbjT (DUF2867 family)